MSDNKNTREQRRKNTKSKTSKQKRNSSILAILLVIIVIIIGNIITQNYSKKTFNDLSQKLESLREDLIKEDVD